jgi:hypothetical protein
MLFSSFIAIFYCKVANLIIERSLNPIRKYCFAVIKTSTTNPLLFQFLEMEY